MSGMEIWGALTGLVSVLQAAGAIGQHYQNSKNARGVEHAKAAANFHHSTYQDVFAAVYSYLPMIERDVEPKLDIQGQVAIIRIKESIERTVTESEDVAKKLRRAVKDPSSRKQEIEAYEEQLRSKAALLNTLQMTLCTQLHLEHVRRRSFTESENQRINFFETIESRRRDSHDSNTLMRAPTFSSSTTVDSGYSTGKEDTPGFIADRQLQTAVEKGDLAAVKTELNNANGGEEPTALASTALILGCRHRQPSIVSHILTSVPHSIDPTLTDPSGLNALHNTLGTADVSSSALSAKIAAILSLLLNNGFSASTPDRTPQAYTPLHRAAIHGNLSAVKILLRNNPQMVNEVDPAGKTALYHACTQGSPYVELIHYLIEKRGHFGGKKRPSLQGQRATTIRNMLDMKGVK